MCSLNAVILGASLLLSTIACSLVGNVALADVPCQMLSIQLTSRATGTSLDYCVSITANPQSPTEIGNIILSGPFLNINTRVQGINAGIDIGAPRFRGLLLLRGSNINSESGGNFTLTYRTTASGRTDEAELTLLKRSGVWIVEDGETTINHINLTAVIDGSEMVLQAPIFSRR